MHDGYTYDANVTLAGFTSHEDVIEILRDSAASVVPSQWAEPFGRVAIESMSVGTPVIYATSGALADIVGPGGTPLHSLDESSIREALDRIFGAGDRSAIRLVGRALELVDGLELGIEAPETRELLDEAHVHLGCFDQDVRELGDFGKRLLDVVEDEEIRSREHLVDHVVHLLGQRVDVLTVEGRHEARVETTEDLARDLVTVALALVDARDLVLECSVSVGWGTEQVSEATGALGHVLGGFVEEGVERLVAGYEPEPHRWTSGLDRGAAWPMARSCAKRGGSEGRCAR